MGKHGAVTLFCRMVCNLYNAGCSLLYDFMSREKLGWPPPPKGYGVWNAFDLLSLLNISSTSKNQVDTCKS